jgi:type IV secretory pathway VirB2 component (pilin)
MRSFKPTPLGRTRGTLIILTTTLAIPGLVWAQADSPFNTGATNLQQALLTIGTPIAIILVIALGVAAIANRISWGWALGVIVGIGLIFASTQIVTWARGMFGA